MKILLVEDSRSIAILLTARLEALGHSVLHAENGAKAVELFPDAKADLVLMDIEMPIMNGFEAVSRIRAFETTQQWAWTPIIFLTASEASESLVTAIEAGGDDFIVKSAPESVLEAKMKAMTRIAQLRQRLTEALQTLDRQAAELAAWNAQLEIRVAEDVSKIERLGRLQRFFSPAVADLLLSGNAEDPLKPRRREIVVIFLDLRGYTEFTESHGPEEVMRVLSEFHEAMGRLIMKYGGTLERFTGDGLMVFFNDPIVIPDPSLRAAKMALDMQQNMTLLQSRWLERGFSLAMGIGIAKGIATIGGIGFEMRKDYGAIGSVTNLAARLCSEAKGGQVLMSEVVALDIQNDMAVNSVGEHTLKGFHQPVGCYELGHS
jgi:class 3 adenylate cyclase